MNLEYVHGVVLRISFARAFVATACTVIADQSVESRLLAFSADGHPASFKLQGNENELIGKIASCNPPYNRSGYRPLEIMIPCGGHGG